MEDPGGQQREQHGEVEREQEHRGHDQERKPKLRRPPGVPDAFPDLAGLPFGPASGTELSLAHQQEHGHHRAVGERVHQEDWADPDPFDQHAGDDRPQDP